MLFQASYRQNLPDSVTKMGYVSIGIVSMVAAGLGLYNGFDIMLNVSPSYSNMQALKGASIATFGVFCFVAGACAFGQLLPARNEREPGVTDPLVSQPRGPGSGV